MVFLERATAGFDEPAYRDISARLVELTGPTTWNLMDAVGRYLRALLSR